MRSRGSARDWARAKGKRQARFCILSLQDAIVRQESVQNWNSGLLLRQEMVATLEALIELCDGNVIAVDVNGEFSPVYVQGLMRHWLHEEQHAPSENDQVSSNLARQRRRTRSVPTTSTRRLTSTSSLR